jgi:uncharacterized membrane protein
VSKGRLEAFSDGVIAILITIMVLELRAPESADLEALAPLAPVFLSYALSFANLGIYWNNHHHLLQAAKVVDGHVLWANVVVPLAAVAIYVAVAVIWFVPDRRIERTLAR